MTKIIATKIVKCHNCNSNNYSVITNTSDYNYKTCSNIFTYVRCADCSQVYLLNRPENSEIKTIYPSDYVAYENKPQKNNLTNYIKSYFEKKKLKNFQNLKQQAVIMEVGCGSGKLLELIKKYGNASWKLIGVDYSDSAFDKLNKLGIETIQGDFEDINIDSKPDVIIMNQVIEHLSKPKSAIKKAFNLIADKGIFILETPSLEGWDNKLFEKDGIWEGWHAPRHWHLYDENLLKDLLLNNGFKIIKAEYILSPYLWIYSIKSYCEHNKKFKFILPYLNLNNFFALSIVSVIDVVQLLIRKKTSNMRITAQKLQTNAKL